MNHSKIAVRYSKALFLLSEERGLTDVVRKDIQLLSVLVKSNEEFIFFLNSPVLKTKQKQEIVHSIFKSELSSLTLDFIDLLLKHKREAHLLDICRNFNDVVRRDKNIISGSFVTAAEISPEIERTVKKIAEDYFKSEVELNSEIDKDIIGGYILRVGDNQLDASVSSKLIKIKRELIITDFDIKY